MVENGWISSEIIITYVKVLIFRGIYTFSLMIGCLVAWDTTRLKPMRNYNILKDLSNML